MTSFLCNFPAYFLLYDLSPNKPFLHIKTLYTQSLEPDIKLSLRFKPEALQAKFVNSNK